MADNRVQLKLGDFQYRPAELTERGGPVYQGLQRAGRKVVDLAKRQLTDNGHVDTGKLRNSITYEIVKGPKGLTCLVGTRMKYALYLHEGTANKGAGRIYPLRARVLRFRPKGSATVVFAESVRGVKPFPFLVKALEQFRASDMNK
jgi:hypothetical protein